MQAVGFTYTLLEKSNPEKRVITPKEREKEARGNLNKQLKEIAKRNLEKS